MVMPFDFKTYVYDHAINLIGREFKNKKKVYYIELGNYISLITNSEKYFLFLLKNAWKLSDAWEEHAIGVEQDRDRVIVVPHLEKIMNIKEIKIILEFIKDNTRIIDSNRVKRFAKPRAHKINF